jgi:predicted RNase H-like HicB family nuclease
MNATYTAICTQRGPWWVGWVEEIPGVNAQEKTQPALLASLREILGEALEFNRQEARAAAGKDYIESPLAV